MRTGVACHRKKVGIGGKVGSLRMDRGREVGRWFPLCDAYDPDEAGFGVLDFRACL
jgi:hypothetical protein